MQVIVIRSDEDGDVEAVVALMPGETARQAFEVYCKTLAAVKAERDPDETVTAEELAAGLEFEELPVVGVL
jgi:hypothetical protein